MSKSLYKLNQKAEKELVGVFDIANNDVTFFDSTTGRILSKEEFSNRFPPITFTRAHKEIKLDDDPQGYYGNLNFEYNGVYYWVENT